MANNWSSSTTSIDIAAMLESLREEQCDDSAPVAQQQSFNPNRCLLDVNSIGGVYDEFLHTYPVNYTGALPEYVRRAHLSRTARLSASYMTVSTDSGESSESNTALESDTRTPSTSSSHEHPVVASLPRPIIPTSIASPSPVYPQTQLELGQTNPLPSPSPQPSSSVIRTSKSSERYDPYHSGQRSSRTYSQHQQIAASEANRPSMIASFIRQPLPPLMIGTESTVAVPYPTPSPSVSPVDPSLLTAFLLIANAIPQSPAPPVIVQLRDGVTMRNNCCCGKELCTLTPGLDRGLVARMALAHQQHAHGLSEKFSCVWYGCDDPKALGGYLSSLKYIVHLQKHLELQFHCTEGCNAKFATNAERNQHSKACSFVRSA